MLSRRSNLSKQGINKALAKGYFVDEVETPFRKRRIGNTNINPLAVTGGLLLSAARIKLDILRTVKATAALRKDTGSVSGPVPLMARLRDSFPGLLQWVAPLALLYLFLRALMGPAFFSATRYFGTPGDTNQYMWFIGWFWWAIQHGHDPMVTPAFNYPTPINIMDYTSVPALGFFFGWLYPVAGMLFTFNLIIVVNYLLIFVFGKLTLRALGVSQTLSGVAGLLFCLLPYITAQGSGHLNLAFIAPLFIAGYFVVRVIRSVTRPGWQAGALIGMAWVFVFYTSLETTLTFLFCLTVIYACGLFCDWKATVRFSRPLLSPGFLVGIMTPLLLTIPGLLNFLAGQPAQPIDFIGFANTFSADLLSFVIPTQVFLIHTSATTAITNHFTGNLIEWDSYLSIPLILLAIIFMVRFWRDSRIRILAHATVVMIVLSLGPFPHAGGARAMVPLPWLFVALLHVPFLDNALPVRLGLYVQVLAVTLIILGIDRYVSEARAPTSQTTHGARLSAGLAALALVALFWMPNAPLPTSTLPEAARIFSSEGGMSPYLRGKPTLVLSQGDAGFNVMMGLLAQSRDFDVRTSNICGCDGGMNTSFEINRSFTNDTDGQQTDIALRQYLPQLGVSRVMFVSIDDRPLDPQRLNEISSYLGPPLYDNQRLVVIWDATGATAAAQRP